MREIAAIRSIGALVSWDQETYLRPRGHEYRAEQSGFLAKLAHEKRTHPRIGELLAACAQDENVTGDPRLDADLRQMQRDYTLATKIPADLVEELAKTGSQSQEVWKVARQKSDFAMFSPWLTKMTDLSIRKAECYGTPAGGELYDALLDEYEPSATAREIEAVFTPLRSKLAALIGELTTNGTAPSTSVLDTSIDADLQHEFGQFVLRAMGFDLDAGRLDTTTHPFCSGVAPGDTRLTTRYRDEHFTDALYGTMHEGGHGLYEQGLPKLDSDAYGSMHGRPLAEDAGMGIHESQSRMWENFVGRSHSFWTWALPHANSIMGNALSKHSADDLYRATNTCTPSFIRVESDEATYNLHIMLRFQIERALFRKELKASDVPSVWNAAFKEMFGLDVPDDRRGCLQDVHWAFGLMGYFPTYCLGNLYAAQFWETATSHIPNLDTKIARGEMLELRDWLRANIHQHGRRYPAAELCQRITGKPLSADPLLRHLEKKLRPVYGV